MGMACSTNWGAEEYKRILMGKPEGKRLLRRPSRRWVDNVKMEHRGTG
jgi:hypothetical protein